MAEPLKKRTMTLNDLQMRTLAVIRKVRFQLGRRAHEEGMCDAEFIEQVLEPLETDIYQDRQVLKMYHSPLVERKRLETLFNNGEHLIGKLLYQLDQIEEHFTEAGEIKGSGQWRLRSIGECVVAMRAAVTECSKADDALHKSEAT